MRIMILGSLISTHSAKWVNSFAVRGHQVMLVSYPIQQKKNIVFDKSVIVHPLRFSGKLGYYLNVPEVRRLNKSFKPDVVNVHYASGFGTLARLAGLRPLVVSCYGTDVFTYPFLNRFNMYNIRKNLNYADAIGCTSNIMANQTRMVLGKPDQEITVTPFGVNIKKCAPMSFERKDDRPVIGIIKYLEPIYDIPLLINAFNIIYKEMENKPLLRIYGDGHLRDELIALTVQLGINDSVIFMGPIPNSEVPKALSEMDIFVNCSKKESFGVNMVEAMACEVPIVATETAGANEVIQQNVTGIVLKDRNPETMANAFRELLSDKNRCRTIGKAGRERVIDLYDWEKNVIIMEKLYISLIAKK